MSKRLSLGNAIEVTKIEGAGPHTPVRLAELLDITLPSATAEEVEYTNQDSLAREFFKGLEDHGEGSYEMNWNPESVTHTTLESLFTTGEFIKISFKLMPTANNTFAYTKEKIGFVKGYEISSPVAGKYTATVTFRFNGDVL